MGILRKLIIIVLCLFVVNVSGAVFGSNPSIFQHGQGTSTTNNVYIFAFHWSQQFPNRNVSEGRSLMFMCPVVYWKSWGTTKKIKMVAAVTKLLSGEVRLTKANLVIWKQRLVDAGIVVELVLPGDRPVVGMKLYIVVVGTKEIVSGRIDSFGLKQPILKENQ